MNSSRNSHIGLSPSTYSTGGMGFGNNYIGFTNQGNGGYNSHRFGATGAGGMNGSFNNQVVSMGGKVRELHH